MDAVSWSITISGWVAAMISVGYIFVLEHRERAERRQKAMLQALLVKATAEPVMLGADGLRTQPRRESTHPDLRSILIKAAVRSDTVSAARAAARRERFSKDEVDSAIDELTRAGLLICERPYTERTNITLAV